VEHGRFDGLDRRFEHVFHFKVHPRRRYHVGSCGVSERAHQLALHFIRVAREGDAQELCQRSVTARQAIETNAQARPIALRGRHTPHHLAIGDDGMMSWQLQGHAHVDAGCHGQGRAQEETALAKVDRGTEDRGFLVLEPAAAAHGSALIGTGPPSGLPLNWYFG
jgi:hypothetical protein